MTRLIGAIALLLAPVAVSADIQISEIMYDASGSDTKREWIEIRNTGSVAVDLTAWKFEDASKHVLNAPPKNGGTGSLVLAPGAYAIIAADAQTFLSEYPGLTNVIDTVMSLKNTGSSIALVGESTASATYTKSLGANGTGDSLQLHNGAWIHAQPSPGAPNATVASVAKFKEAKASVRPQEKKVAALKANAAIAETDETFLMEERGDDKAAQVAVAENASTGALPWWLAAAALSIGTAAAVTMISRARRGEWDIVEESD
jgi:hypothetical protein